MFGFDLCPGDGADLAAGGTVRSCLHTVDNEHARSHTHTHVHALTRTHAALKAALISPARLKAWSALHYHTVLLLFSSFLHPLPHLLISLSPVPLLLFSLLASSSHPLHLPLSSPSSFTPFYLLSFYPPLQLFL